MPTYTQLKDLHDWEDDTALIEIAPDGTAIVREPAVQMIPNLYTPFAEAVANAGKLMARSPWINRIAVRLQDGATWDIRNGELG
ncbi:hypothetical protein G6L74_06155 [Agrobacterium tumefaciens]|uniref:hypothetical protein n=1 Tax=Agrobacterium tumefaciens TaxID=358 RepID=UPI00157344CD|nr:hypothetical protein [Agrobacterium tumefaciens]